MNTRHNVKAADDFVCECARNPAAFLFQKMGERIPFSLGKL